MQRLTLDVKASLAGNTKDVRSKVRSRSGKVQRIVVILVPVEQSRLSIFGSSDALGKSVKTVLEQRKGVVQAELSLVLDAQDCGGGCRRGRSGRLELIER